MSARVDQLAGDLATSARTAEPGVGSVDILSYTLYSPEHYHPISLDAVSTH